MIRRVRRIMVMSDVHLTTHVRHDGPWLGYRRADLSPDAAIHLAVERALADHIPLELVLAGDLFDLDAPPDDAVPSAATYKASRSEPGAARTMQRILADHPRFIAAISRVLRAGGSVVVLPGNHDAQLSFPAVWHVLQAATVPSPRLVYRSWFHRSGPVVVEHGHQYDPLCALDRLFPEWDEDTLRMEDTVSSVATHYGHSLFGLVNPYASDPFAVSAEDKPALKACARRVITDSEALACALAGFRDVLLSGRAGTSAEFEPWLSRVAAETSSSRAQLDAHRGLAAPKGDASLLARSATRKGDYAADCDERQAEAMRELAALYRARVVVMGHTHEPFVRSANGAVFANSGAWTPPLDRHGPRGSFIDILVDGPQVRHVALRRVLADGSVQ